ncbi:MAG: hypothetical protein RL199_803 [Pseudomonadota bacterium]|jgi:hypothetical protein
MKSIHWTAALVSLALMQGCSGSTAEHGSSIDSFVRATGPLSVAEEQSKREVECESLCPASGQEGDQFCTYKRYQQTDHSDQFVALQPNSASLWPGNLLRGGDAAVGLLTPLGLKQSPLTFSISLENLKADKSSAKMSSPSLSAFREARNDILGKGVSGSTPAALTLSISEVKSLDDVAFKLGAGLKWPGANKIAATFNFNKETKTSKVLVDFTQAYYTIDVDAKARPSDFFGDDVTVDDVKSVVGQGNPPLYVQSITYGRRVIFAIETSSSLSDVKLALDAAYGNGKVGIDGSVDASKKATLDTSSIQAFVLGGDADDAVGVVSGFDGVVSYIKKGGNYSKESPGAPIAYKLAYLDNTVTKLAFTTDYAERVCTKNQGTVKASLSSVKHLAGEDTGDKDHVELRGRIGVRVPTIDNPVTADCDGGEVLELWSNDPGDIAAYDYIGSAEWRTKYAEAPFMEIARGGVWTPADLSEFERSTASAALGKGQQVCLFATLWEAFAPEDDDWFTSIDDVQDTLLTQSHKLVDLGADNWAKEYGLTVQGPANFAVQVNYKVSGE